MRQTFLLGLMAVMLSGPAQADTEALGENPFQHYRDTAPAHTTTLCPADWNELIDGFYLLDIDRVKELLGAGARVNERCSIPAGKDSTGMNRPGLNQATPLHLATYTHFLAAEVVQVLLDAGGNLKAKGYLGWSPLHYAAMNEHYKLVEVFLNAGALVNARGTSGETPLHLALMFNRSIDKKTIKALLGTGARINAKDDDGSTPLDWHTKSEGPDISQFLIEAGGRCNTKC